MHTLSRPKPLTPEQGKQSRERSLAAVKQFQEVSKRLEDLCELKGIPVPILTMQG